MGKLRACYLLVVICLWSACSTQKEFQGTPRTIDTKEHPLPVSETDVLSPNHVKEPQNLTEYVVQPGDTLFSICRAFGMRIEELQSLNNLTGTELRAGQILLVRNPIRANRQKQTIIHDLPMR